MTKELKEAKKKIEMLTNHLLDSIDCDLLSESQKNCILKSVTAVCLTKIRIHKTTNLFRSRRRFRMVN